MTEFPPGPGGIGSHAYGLATSLVLQGSKVKVLTNADYVDQTVTADFDKKQLFEIQRFTRYGQWVYFKRIRLIYKTLQTQVFDTVVLSNTFALWMALWIRIWKPKQRIVAVVHGSEVNPASFRRILTHKALRRCSQIVAVSQYTASILPDRIQKRVPVVVIPNGIDIHRWNLVSPTAIKLSGSPKLLTVGNVTSRKGQQCVIAALPHLLSLYPELHYHIVGLPTQKEEFLALAKQLKVEVHVTFHGKIASLEELAGYYQAADVFMLLSQNQANGDVEGFGIVALEAGLFGLPVIGAVGSGVAEAVCEKFSGMLVEGNNPEQIGEALRQCLCSSDMRTNTRQWAEAHSWEKIVGEYLKVL